MGPREKRERMRKRVGWAENQGKEGDWFCIFEKEANKFNTNSNSENSNLNRKTPKKMQCGMSATQKEQPYLI